MKSRRIIYRLCAALFAVMAMQSFAAIVSVTTKVTEIWPRDWGLHFVMETQAATQLNSIQPSIQCSGVNLQSPFVTLTNANYKTYKDSLMLAYVLKRTVRVHFDTTVACASGGYPSVYAIDLLPQ